VGRVEVVVLFGLFYGLLSDFLTQKPLCRDIRLYNVLTTVTVTDLMDVVFYLYDMPSIFKGFDDDRTCFKSATATVVRTLLSRLSLHNGF